MVPLPRGAKGGNMPVGRTHARNATARPAVAQCLLRRGGLGPTVRVVLMRTTCVGGVPRCFPIGDPGGFWGLPGFAWVLCGLSFSVLLAIHCNAGLIGPHLSLI